MNHILYERIYRLLAGRQRRAVEATEEFALGSTIGSVRARNEDVAAIVTARHGRSSQRDYTLALVCDGMGGMADGRHAALIAASAFIARMLQADRFGAPLDRLNWALAAAQYRVFDELRGEGGTTLSVIYVDQRPDAWLTHVGDSRICGVTSSGALRQLSRDDTIGAALNRENERRPDSNRLIQYVGAEGDLDPQLLGVSRDQFSGFLLTSDGAHSAPPDILSTVAHRAKSPSDLVRKLLSLSDVLGGLDNATAVYIPSTLQPQVQSLAWGQADDQDSVLATILCASGEHDIWMAHLEPYNESGAGPGLGIAKGMRSASPSPSASPENSPATNKAKSTKRSKPAKKRAQLKSGDELPLDVEKPIAKLDFSDGEEEPS